MPTNKYIDVSIPKVFISEFNEMLAETHRRLANDISKKYNLDMNEVLKTCVPKTPVISLNTNIPSKITIDNYEKANTIEELNDLLVKDLKIILSKRNLTVSGKKEQLISRLWENMQNKKNNTIPFKLTLIDYKHTDDNLYKLMPSKSWLFKENGDYMEFIGELKNNIINNIPPPKEVLDLLE